MKYFTLLILLFLLLVSACDSTVDISDTGVNLVEAAEQGDAAKVDQLLSIGAAADKRDACQWTPLMKAALYGHTQIAERLLAAGAERDLMDKGGYTALMLAASNDHVEIVDMLAAAGANVNHVESTNGWTALIWAAKRGHRETVSRLLELGADPRLMDHKGSTALDWALAEQHARVIALLNPAN